MSFAPALVLVAGTLTSLVAHADVDWEKGLVIARGIGLADRHAPNPAVARGPARRKAEQAAAQALTAELAEVPLAAGGTLGDKLGDPKVKARVDRAVEGALTVTADPETDGSWQVTMAVPLEAVRQAITGARALAPSPGDRGPAVVIVEGVTATPAVGYRIGGIAGAIVWGKGVPAWAKGAPRIKAKGTTSDVIEVATPAGGEATLFIVLTRSGGS